MKSEDEYLKFVRWNEEDSFYVGYCPDFFPWGGVCHAHNEEEAYHKLCALVIEEIEQLLAANQELPAASTKPMREAMSV